jgi:hypothetical protein
LIALTLAGCEVVTGLSALGEVDETPAAEGGAVDVVVGGPHSDGQVNRLDASATGQDVVWSPGIDAQPAPHPDVNVPDGEVLLSLSVLGAPGEIQAFANGGIGAMLDCTITGGPTCSGAYATTSAAYIYATVVDGGPRFVKWTGACAAAVSPNCILPMDTSKAVAATFE